MATISSFADWVRQRRMVLGLTQATLAARVGCALVTIKKIEQETRHPSLELAELLCTQLAIPADERAAFLRLARGEYVETVVRATHITPPPTFLQTPGEAAPTALCVARERELVQLETHLIATLNGSGRIVFVTGEAGRGKTTLMAEFARRGQERFSDMVVAFGNCDAYAGSGDPYLPFRDILTLLSGDVESRWKAGTLSQEHALRLWSLLPQMVQSLADYGPDLHDVFFDLPALLRRCKAAAPQPGSNWIEVLTRLEQRQARPVVAQQQLFEQYTRVLSALADHCPLLLVLDDLQWTDTASAGLLYHLGRRLSGSRVLILGAYRPSEVSLPLLQEESTGERHPLAPIIQEIKRRYGDIEIDLGVRGPETGRAFIGALLDQVPNRLDASFREALLQRTQGHPLFTVELLREMAARHDLVRDEAGRWMQGTAADWEALPTRVEAVIAGRIGRLPLQVQEALKIASVEGETFTAEVVARVQGVDEPQLVRQLGSVVDRQHRLVRSLGSERLGEQLLSRYRFGHILFQNYLYKSLDVAERIYLHEAVGRALEALYGEQVEQVAVQLAHHFQMTGLTAKAVDYLYQVGVRAARLSAHQEAIVHLNKGLSLLASSPPSAECAQQELRLQLALGVSMSTLKGMSAPEVKEIYLRAQALSEEVGDDLQRFIALDGLYDSYVSRGEVQTARALAEELITLATRLGNSSRLAEACASMGVALLQLGQLTASRVYLHRGMGDGEYQWQYATGLVSVQHVGSTSQRHLALALWYLGYPEQALRHMEESLALVQALAHPYSLAATLSMSTSLHQMRGEPRLVQVQAERALSLSEQQGFRYWLAHSLVLLGWALAQQGQVTVGIARIREGLDQRRAIAGWAHHPTFLALLAECYGWAGQPEHGLRLLEEGLGRVATTDERCTEAELHRMRGELLQMCSAHAQVVEACFQQALTVARQQEAKSLELRAAMSLSRLWQHQEKRTRARDLLAGIYEWFTEGFDTVNLLEAKALLNEL